jgi:hypothetical protein
MAVLRHLSSVVERIADHVTGSAANCSNPQRLGEDISPGHVSLRPGEHAAAPMITTPP